MHEPRLATLRDLEAIEQCAQQSYHPYVERIGQPPAPMIADFRSHIQHGQVHVLTDMDDSLCGFVIFHRSDDCLFLENVAVAPDKQGNGYGRHLIAFAEWSALQSGLAIIRLYTNIHMEENLGLYKALGYAEIDRRREDGFDRVYFEKHLGQIG
ncbi:MAG: GNAT family N-acetyltransferase [Alphaproteobacteria bacterium]|nr:GNAT family N-acetyltransferase [Alphaproteobacteria bacterium]